jgi:hypothetical protein
MRDQFETGKIVKRRYLPEKALEHSDGKEWWAGYQWKGF